MIIELLSKSVCFFISINLLTNGTGQTLGIGHQYQTEKVLISHSLIFFIELFILHILIHNYADIIDMTHFFLILKKKLNI